MKVGEYARTKWGCIAKFEGINEGFYEFDNIIMDESSAVREELFVDIVEKSSPNIIDLIEVGDIIKKTYKTGLIEKIPINKIEDIEHIKLDLKNGFKLTIVTNEQFLQMEYRIGE